MDIAVNSSGKPSEVYGDVVWTHRGRQVGPRTGEPEAVRGRHPQEHHHVRHRPGRHRQDVPRHGDGGGRVLRQAGRAHHPDAAGGGGGGEPRLPARHGEREGRPVLPAAVRRPLRHDRRREAGRAHREGRDRGGAARVHARAHAQRLVHHPRRGAEHLARADEDVPHAPWVRQQDGGHRRRHPDRPAAQPDLGTRHRARGPRGDRRHQHRALRRTRRGAPQARPAHRQRLQGARRRGGRGAGARATRLRTAARGRAA